MTPDSIVKLTIAFTDPTLDDEDKDAAVLNLLPQLKELDAIQTVARIPDPKPPVGNKTGGGFLVGLLLAEVSKENLKKVMGFLGDRLGSKPIKLKVKAPDGRELELEASSQAEFDYAYQKAQKFLKS